MLGDSLLSYPPTLHLGWKLPVLVRLVSVCCATLHCATAPHCTGLDASCSGAMSIDVLGDPSLCCLPTLQGIYGACFGAMGVGFLCNPLQSPELHLG